MKRTCVGLLLPALAALVLSSCATYASGLGPAVRPSGSPSPVGFDVAMTLWTQHRGTRPGLEKAIEALRLVVADEPQNQEALALLSQALWFLADSFEDDEKKRLGLFEEGVTFGERAMACDSQFKARVDQGGKTSDAVAALQADDLAALYWTAANLDSWSAQKGGLTRVRYRGYVSSMMTTCLELDETAFWGAPCRFWGAWHARSDPDLSREMFEKARAMFPERFATYVSYAETYAVRTGDRVLFHELLSYVTSQPDDVLPDLVPEQRADQRKARALLDRIDEFFPDIG